jgi:hypothetical protein
MKKIMVITAFIASCSSVQAYWDTPYLEEFSQGGGYTPVANSSEQSYRAGCLEVTLPEFLGNQDEIQTKSRDAQGTAKETMKKILRSSQERRNK